MNQIVTVEQARDITVAIPLLGEMITEAFASDKSRVEKAHRIGVVLDQSPDPLNWLSTLDSKERTYWSDRDGLFEMAGVGIADLITGGTEYSITGPTALIRERLDDQKSEARYFGGFSFQKLLSDSLWSKFGTARFVLPRFELIREKNESKLICNLIFPNDRVIKDEIIAMLNKLRTDKIDSTLPSVLTRADYPDHDNWSKGVNNALAFMRKSEVEKIVLARKSMFEFDLALSSLDILKRLKESSTGCYHFCFEPDESAALVGASPERLYSRRGQKIKSEAIAGTRPRGENEADDIFLAEQLSRSEKDLREHNYVALTIKKGLEKLCDELINGGRVDIVKLARVQHLVSHFEGCLKPDVTDSEILSALHPTPAVGGYPTAEAIEKIAELEPFERGWYASPVGWIGSEAAEFAVAIRSGLVAKNQLVLYSGAGIVAGSEPEKEWDEIESKISNFLGVINRT